MNIRFDFRDLDRVFARLSSFVATQTMLIAGPLVIESIKANSAAGRDAKGQQMKPYTPEYAKRRKAMGLQTGHVDLRTKKSDTILDTLATEGNRTSVPASKEGQAEGLQSQRDWLGADKETVEQAIPHALVEGINKLT